MAQRVMGNEFWNNLILPVTSSQIRAVLYYR